MTNNPSNPSFNAGSGETIRCLPLGWWLLLTGWLGCLASTSRYDLPLSSVMTDVNSRLAWAVAYFGEWPGVALALLSAAALWFGRDPASRWRAHRPLFLAIVVITLLYPTFVVQLLKLLWGRVRFVHLAADRSNFTPFYRRAGVSAGRSFPSGHAAIASVGTPIPGHLWQRGNRRSAAAALAAVSTVMLTVGWGRIVAGKHYLTDVLFSLGAMTLLGIAARRCAARRHADSSRGQRHGTDRHHAVDAS